MDFDEDKIDAAVDDIIAQLKGETNKIKNVEVEYPDLQPEDVDKFIIDMASKLVTDAASVIQQAKNAQTANEVIALSEIIKSTGSVLEILQKRKIADNKNKTSKELTQMNIEAKKELPDGGTQREGITFSREEIFKLISENAKKSNEPPEPPVIDV